jgi:very-short-patch-repair endonuclease
MNYDKMSEKQKKELLSKEYEINNKSFQDIAKQAGTYANKIRRDAIKFKINIRDKSEAQKNALKTGKASHPTEGKKRPESVKSKIGLSVMNSWENLDQITIQQRKEKARQNWENLPEDTKENILREANAAVREASKNGSKLEKFLLNKLLEDGFKVDFHKEQSLLNTKLQIDLFLPTLNIAIEVDGPSHFKPVWGNDNLKRNKGYDNKKTGLILGKGLVLIRIKQTKDFSKARAQTIYNDLKNHIKSISEKFPDQDNRNITIGDE